MIRTFWNGEPTPCRKVVVRVGASPKATWWCANLEGSERQAVEVRYGTEIYLLDNEDGAGWFKVTEGKGSPFYPHRSLPDASPVLRDAP